MAGQAARLGFTLAEVLITLGIIGVVAAMTLATLINNYKAMRDVTIAKKKFAEVQQIISSIQAELGDYSNWSGMNTNAFFEQYVDKHINYVKKKKLGVTGENLIYKEAEINHVCNYIYEMADGTILIFGIPSAGISTQDKDKDRVWKIHVDINGLKEPNALGRDVFTMTLNTSQTETSPYYEYGFHAYGSGLDDDEIKKRCSENYQSNYYKMNVDYGNHIWVMSIFANQNDNAHGRCTCLEYLIRNSWDYKKFPPKK